MKLDDTFSRFLYRFRDANSARFGKFKNSGGVVIDCASWTTGDWVMALVGEIGEAAEIIETIRRRNPHHIATAQETSDLAAEYADIETYVDILGMKLNIDLVSAMEFHGEKFQTVPGWSANDYMTALIACTGKMANWLKKILRDDVKMYSEKDGQTIRYWVEEGIAGIQSYLMILAIGSCVNLREATVDKWNRVSNKINFDYQLV